MDADLADKDHLTGHQPSSSRSNGKRGVQPNIINQGSRKKTDFG
ncbi:hypothetical protein [Peribacillus simplex]